METARPPSTDRQVVALGTDHGGHPLKEHLKPALAELGYDVWDMGTHGPEPVDYPDFAVAVARAVAEGRAWRGIMIDGAGIGSAMAANKIRGVRAALCYDRTTAENAREHNDANVLTLGAGLIGTRLALEIVRTFLATPFGGGRHARRVEKINLLDAARG
ncbi:MAG: ribose 5-phosphate isomerase B [Gemmatimonadetes bacterium]|nr:ribose 5-phosphate isomerase B [Gemmatimonadota bacterium]